MENPPRPPDGLSSDAPLAPYTTIRVGGTADRLVTVNGSRAAVRALAWARHSGLPVAVIGRGSNLLVDDRGFRGLAIRLSGALNGISVRGTDIWCGGGSSLPRAVQRAARFGLTGLEWGASIPGTAGGAVAMNAGAHAGELAHSLRWAVVVDADGRRLLTPAELEFGYRRSAVSGDQIVTMVCFALEAGAVPAIKERLDQFRGHRRRTQPQGVRTFGSVFANPTGGSAGRLLEEAGCKEVTIGGARFSPVHANFIEAMPGCRTADVLALMAEGRRRVRAAGGPLLHPEVRYLDAERGIIAPPLETL